MKKANKYSSAENPKKPAVAAALKYDGENAPTLVAKGQGAVAEEIIRQAQQHQVHIHEDPMLLEVLSRLELGDEVPHQLYLAVAKIIAFAYYLQGKHPNSQPKPAEDSASISQDKKQFNQQPSDNNLLADQ